MHKMDGCEVGVTGCNTNGVGCCINRVWVDEGRCIWHVGSGVESVGAPVAGVRVQGTTSLLGRVMVGLGGMQMGCEGVVGLSSRRGAGLGLTKDDGGLLEPLGHPFALGLMSEVGVHA